MTWPEMAIESLDAAKKLKESGHARSALSRAYYSAYALLTGELQRTKHTVSVGIRPNPSHEQLAKLAKANLDRTRYDEQARLRLARGLRKLKQLRIAADYDPESSLTVDDAVIALRELNQMHRKVVGQR
jgi:uncharacterized protein (UPF0332 family)